jgi:hypothetical protein
MRFDETNSGFEMACLAFDMTGDGGSARQQSPCCQSLILKWCLQTMLKPDTVDD